MYSLFIIEDCCTAIIMIVRYSFLCAWGMAHFLNGRLKKSGGYLKKGGIGPPSKLCGLKSIYQRHGKKFEVLQDSLRRN